MLEELHVRDLALIEDVWLEFGPGMTALTGETGAGKTALLGALKLLLGERADSNALRPGASEALVEGRFAIGGTELLANRRVSAEGRSKARIDGEMATVGELAARLGPLVDLHGQHEHQALLTTSSHVGYLDRWGAARIAPTLAAYRESLSAYRDAVAARDEVARRMADAIQRADYLRFLAEEIDRVDPQVGEDEALESRLPALRHAERLRDGVQEALDALRSERGATDSGAAALVTLEKLTGIDPILDGLAEEIRGAVAALEDAGQQLRSYRDAVEHDPEALDRAETRLSELNGMTKKYGPRLCDVIERRDEARAALSAAEAGESGLEAANRLVAERESSLRDAATALSDVRGEVAPAFAVALGDASADLAMDGARFEVALTELPFDAWGADGAQRVEFLYGPAAGTTPRPLSKIASGGEISRVMLALKGVLGAADDVPLLVFDEVDAGIGGATAHAVGRRLARLARGRQVIVVTHLAQVAAYAQAQLVVTKEIDGGVTRTVVRQCDGESRVDELARMLSGGGTQASRDHAVELLEQARSAASTG